jgi:hypothetical protein
MQELLPPPLMQGLLDPTWGQPLEATDSKRFQAPKCHCVRSVRFYDVQDGGMRTRLYTCTSTPTALAKLHTCVSTLLIERYTRKCAPRLYLWDYARGLLLYFALKAVISRTLH